MASDENEKPTTIKDFYRRAVASSPQFVEKVVVDWVFWEAKAAGRREIAAAKLKRLLDTDYMFNVRASTLPSDAARQLVMAEGVDPITMYKAEVELSDACEQLSACGRMISLLSARK